MRHSYVYDEKIINPTAIRSEANARAVGDSRNKSQSTLIHFHYRDNPCEGRQHEFVRLVHQPDGSEQVEVMQFTDDPQRVNLDG